MTTPLPPLSEVGPIRASLGRHLDRVLAVVPAEGRGVFETTASLTGVESHVAHRVGRGWTVGAWGAYEWTTRRAEAGGRLRKTW